MKILGIDSSGLVASVAMVADEEMVAEYTICYKKTHSQTLLPMLDEIVKMIEFDLNDIDAIAVAAGPGSFTGLRIGSATAKGLGFALNKPLISVSTLEGLAYNLFGADQLICPLMDARRNQVYTGLYRFVCTRTIHKDALSLEPLAETNSSPVFVSPKSMSGNVVDINELIDEINKLEERVIFLGDGVHVYGDILKEKIKTPFSLAPPHLSRQRAGSIAALGELYYKIGKIETAAEHKPVYLRLSQAERERKEREGL